MFAFILLIVPVVLDACCLLPLLSVLPMNLLSLAALNLTTKLFAPSMLSSTISSIIQFNARSTLKLLIRFITSFAGLTKTDYLSTR